MSRTHVHTPVWVLKLQGGTVAHDHRKGYCSLAPVAATREARYRHYRTCKKLMAYEVTCEHMMTTPASIFFIPLEGEGYISPKVHQVVEAREAVSHRLLTRAETLLLPLQEECQVYRTPLLGWPQRPDPQGKTLLIKPHRGDRARHQYTVLVREESIPCSCDSYEDPTCYLEVPWEDFVKHFSRNPGEGQGQAHHGRARARERVTLASLRALYNSGMDLEEDDF